MPWQQDAATELARITGNQATKKRDTILALVDARISGRSENDVWRLPHTCARSTYHGKWKKDALFADVLASVTELARGARSEIALEALSDAALSLAISAPEAVKTAIHLMGSLDDTISLRAAFGILDRAGVETATKQSSEVSGPDKGAISIDVTQLSDDQLYGILSGDIDESSITGESGN